MSNDKVYSLQQRVGFNYILKLLLVFLTKLKFAQNIICRICIVKDKAVATVACLISYFARFHVRMACSLFGERIDRMREKNS